MLCVVSNCIAHVVTTIYGVYMYNTYSIQQKFIISVCMFETEYVWIVYAKLSLSFDFKLIILILKAIQKSKRMGLLTRAMQKKKLKGKLANEKSLQLGAYHALKNDGIISFIIFFKIISWFCTILKVLNKNYLFYRSSLEYKSAELTSASNCQMNSALRRILTFICQLKWKKKIKFLLLPLDICSC